MDDSYQMHYLTTWRWYIFKEFIISCYCDASILKSLKTYHSKKDEIYYDQYKADKEFGNAFKSHSNGISYWQ